MYTKKNQKNLEAINRLKNNKWGPSKPNIEIGNIEMFINNMWEFNKIIWKQQKIPEKWSNLSYI